MDEKFSSSNNLACNHATTIIKQLYKTITPPTRPATTAPKLNPNTPIRPVTAPFVVYGATVEALGLVEELATLPDDAVVDETTTDETVEVDTPAPSGLATVKGDVVVVDPRVFCVTVDVVKPAPSGFATVKPDAVVDVVEAATSLLPGGT